MSRSISVVFTFLLAIPLLLGSVTATSALTDTTTRELHVGLSTEPESLDPHHASSVASATVLMTLFDPLLWRDSNGELQPGLAESWEVSADGTEYTFHLRNGVVFHDGTAFDAAAVKFNFDRIADSASDSGLAAALLGAYSHTDVIDLQTVRIAFDEPNPAFLDSASQPFLGMVSPTAERRLGDRFSQHPVGTGFMILDDWVAGDRITLIRNADYDWGSPAFAKPGPVSYERMTFRFYPEESLRLTAFKAGEVDILDQVEPRDLAVLADGRSYVALNATALGIPIALVLNTATTPTNELAVRQALNHVLDREQIANFAFRGASQPAYGPLAPDTPLAVDAGISDIPYDPDFAASLLDDAGWEMKDSGIREKDGKQLVLRWAIGPWDSQWAELAQAQIGQLGAVVQIVPMDETKPGDVLRDSNINMVSIAVPGSDPVVLQRLLANPGSSDGSVSPESTNSALAELLQDGAIARTEDERANAYARAQSLIMDEALIVPIALLPENVIAGSNIAGVRRDFRNGLWLHDVTFNSPAKRPGCSNPALS